MLRPPCVRRREPESHPPSGRSRRLVEPDDAREPRARGTALAVAERSLLFRPFANPRGRSDRTPLPEVARLDDAFAGRAGGAVNAEVDCVQKVVPRTGESPACSADPRELFDRDGLERAPAPVATDDE